MIRRMQAGVLIILLTTMSLQGVSATQTTEPDVPTSCRVRPVSVLSLLATLNDVDFAYNFPPLSSVSLDEITPGTPITADDLERITIVTRELVGCANSLQVMSVLAFLSEDLQVRLAAKVLNGEDIDAILAYLPILATDAAQTQGIQAIPIRSAWYVGSGDKAISAILEPVTSDPTTKRSFLVTYVFSVNTWLIYDVQPITGSDIG